MNKYMSNIQENRYLHSSEPNLPEKYKNCSLHIALERADQDQDWNNFKTILNMNKIFLLQHLKMSSGLFMYNYENLSQEEQKELFE
jgi:hypothetical protein